MCVCCALCVSSLQSPFTHVCVCRRELDLYNFGETVTVSGIDLLRFRVPSFELLNSTLNPSNAQYFGHGPSGVLNISNCNLKLPVRLPCLIPCPSPLPHARCVRVYSCL